MGINGKIMYFLFKSFEWFEIDCDIGEIIIKFIVCFNCEFNLEFEFEVFVIDGGIVSWEGKVWLYFIVEDENDNDLIFDFNLYIVIVVLVVFLGIFIMMVFVMD